MNKIGFILPILRHVWVLYEKAIGKRKPSILIDPAVNKALSCLFQALMTLGERLNWEIFVARRWHMREYDDAKFYPLRCYSEGGAAFGEWAYVSPIVKAAGWAEDPMHYPWNFLYTLTLVSTKYHPSEQNNFICCYPDPSRQQSFSKTNVLSGYFLLECYWQNCSYM